MPVRVMKAMGITTLIVTNAAGGINSDYKTGDLMIIKDHIDLPGLTGECVLIGKNDERYVKKGEQECMFFRGKSGIVHLEICVKAEEKTISIKKKINTMLFFYLDLHGAAVRAPRVPGLTE